MPHLTRIALAAAVLSTPNVAAAASAIFTIANFRPPSTTEFISDPALQPGSLILDLSVTTDADIESFTNLSFNLWGGTLYQHPFGSDAEPPHPAFVAAFPAIGADSWITTPAPSTSTIGGFSVQPNAWFDLEDSGPQTDFHFARITTTSGAFTLTGTINLAAGPNGPGAAIPFELTNLIPEPASLTLGVGVAGMLFRKRQRPWAKRRVR